jgi:hypothetical protein
MSSGRVYKSFLIVEDPFTFSHRVRYNTPPYNEAYFGLFGDENEAMLAIDLIYDLLLFHCCVEID